ncbi:MAG: hypothetical protein MUO23_12955 [Anaerolineales bacterium]|nr:hypothetical protein [Anaerolineales bacterium]
MKIADARRDNPGMLWPGVDPPLPFFLVTARLDVGKADVSTWVLSNPHVLDCALALVSRPPGG